MTPALVAPPYSIPDDDAIWFAVSAVPPARGWLLGRVPASELAGYFQASLRDVLALVVLP